MPTAATYVFSGRRLDPVENQQAARLDQINLAAGTYPMGTIVGEVTGTPGTYAAYNSANSDGSQTPAYLIQYDTFVDASGNCYLGASGGSLTNATGSGSTGSQAITPRSMGGIAVGTVLGISGTGTAETVTVTAVTGTTFTATFANAHSGSILVTVSAATSAVSEWGQSSKGAPAYRNGTFACQELVNLDANAVTKLGRIVQGTVTSGKVMVYGQ